MTASTNGQKPKPEWFTEGLLIAAAPVAAYLLTLNYINGYASYFQIPLEFLSLNVPTMFVVGGKILSASLLVYLFFLLVGRFVPAEDGPLLHRILVILPWVGLLYIQILFFGKKWHEWRETFIFSLLLVAMLFILPLVHTDKKSYTEKLLEDSRRFHAVRPRLAAMFFRGDGGRRVILYGTWAWFALTASQNAGRFEAMWKTKFLVSASSPETVAICTYGDNTILSTFNRETKEVEQSFSIRKKGDDPNLLLEWQEVGPLRLKGSQ
jgi:hypothetical protein